ncbi:MAG TPA: phosphatase PAP2 family protein [Gemmataceae bacterium]|jgi:hypothetical protein|nr:phosphatase PAP2 family protein [Gemmataceae bacterium]
MPSRGYPPASWIGVTLLVLSLPACSTPLLAPGGNGVVHQEKPAPAAVARVPSSPESPTPPADHKTSTPEAASSLHQVAWFSGPEGETPSEGHAAWQAGEGAEGSPALGRWDRLGRDVDLVREDYQHYYCTWQNLGELALGVGVAAPLANTSADNSIRNWYQKKVRTTTTDAFADGIGVAGELWIAVPVGLEAWALAGKAGDDYSTDSGLFEWSNRSLRSMAVGTPSLLMMYVTLGAARPDTGDSRWHPFQNIHGASGHTFFGAVPFLTAAEMTDNEFLKVPLFLGSFLTGWSRINNDRHYFSQVVLGWWMAYLSVRRVDDTQAERKSWSLVPTYEDGPGIGVLYRY